jgi:hypothetical protein
MEKTKAAIKAKRDEGEGEAKGRRRNAVVALSTSRVLRLLSNPRYSFSF